MLALTETIAAIATAPGGAARGIIRISGPDSSQIVGRLFRSREGNPLAEIRRATAIAGELTLSDWAGRRAACELYLWPDCHSYTRQPVAELHTIGSPPLLDAVLRSVCAAGARVAEPGEFTLRAFLAGRIDLVQAEAVLGVIDAVDRSELDVALSQLAGGLTRPLAELRDQMLNLLADLEAGLDFVEEVIRFIAPGELCDRLSAAAKAVERILEQMRTRQRSRVEPRVVLVGWPNVGKSSLFNALLGRPAALVSNCPGTTRDYLAASLQLGAMTCELIDTAGHESERAKVDALSTAAQQMMNDQRRQAELRLLCLDATRPLNAWEQAELSAGHPQLIVLTKCDAPGAQCRDLPAIETSAVTGAGLDQLRETIRRQLAAEGIGADSPLAAVAATAARCHESLRLAAECLARAGEMAATAAGDELVAAEIRAALTELGRVVGAVYSDDLLDRIFSRFCIGK